MSSRRLAVWGLRATVLLVAVLALLPVGQLAADWLAYTRLVGRSAEATAPRGFDGVAWRDDGAILAGYVMPRGPGAEAGIQVGDQLAALDFSQVFTAEDVVAQTERATGTVQTYSLNRGRQRVDVDVPIVRYPTFLYPLSQSLWGASGWGFAVATLLHLLALSTVLPFARRSARALRATALIGAASVWVGGNLLRIAWVALAGPPGLNEPLEAAAFDALTLLALAGWVAFPLLLVREVLVADRRTRLASRPVRWALAIPPLVLGLGVSVATLTGHVGPMPPDAFVPPILFYVCVYVAAATAISLAPRGWDPETGATRGGRIGSGLVLLVSVLGALYVVAGLPSPRTESDLTAGWVVTALQLISLLPVGLVSFSTLRFGRFETLLVRGVGYLAGLAVVFLLVAGGAALLDALTPQPGGGGPVAIALWVVAVLALADRFAPSVRRWAQRVFRSHRYEAWRRLDRFGDRVRFILDADDLARETVDTIGEAFEPESAVVFLHTGEATWTQASFRPHPPYFTQSDLERVWTRVREDGRVWAQSAELNEAVLEAADIERLHAVGAALAVPIASGRGTPAGLIVLGKKARALAVYTTDDVERLQNLGGQIALAVERLRLIERERQLVRQTAEAEMAALRAQINPHFLFNALNTVAALIDEQPEAAEQTVESLAGLFRDVLTASGATFVPLADEMRLVRRYLNVEQARFGDKLDVEIDLAEEARAVHVPAFAIQTLVENAVKHGIEGRREGGRIRIATRRDADDVVVDVSDTGVGIPALFASGDGHAPPESAFFGVGLSNVAQRLNQLYDGTDRLTFHSTPSGTRVRLRLPAHA